ncbi:condensin complex subunit 2-like isoform X2 [Asparagus officinalis]|uniref:condensin complex subunit 2-like isoform X2 n=1 Tax=Asparagus officinalis TaxID=4686 RepID=UPI00098DE281|nr:condensin complex subunit 2-like isoform X2 [Asparagus officinalis]
MSPRLQSPILSPKPFPLVSNDDDHERAQARAAIAASVRRRSAAFSPTPPPFRQPEDHGFLDDDQIMDLFQNCVKLASENKINQKNMWQLTLIDHLSEIIRAGPRDEGDETNFQKASCTLEAGVKIYSLRVDSVYSEAYKVLGWINRAGQEEIGGNMGAGDHTQTKQVQGFAKKDLDRKLSPLTTVEPSFEALNIKKFDVAFTVDPLYHQTSAQFDEGGAKGLLLNNFGVYGGCCVLFDLFELPEKTILSEPEYHHANIIDLSFAKENIEQMIVHMHAKSDISPTLRDILSQFGENNCRSSDVLPAAQQPLVQEINNSDHSEAGSDAFDDFEWWNFGRDDHARLGVNDPTDGLSTSDANFSRHSDGNGECVIGNPLIDQKLEKNSDLLILGLGFISKSNAWAGPDHWKYRKAKGLEQMPCSDNENESELASKEPKIKKGVPDIDFTKSLDMQMPNIFASPKSPKSLILPANRSPCITKLPEDCHYRPENLVRLFLLPGFMRLGEKARKISDESMQYDNFIPFASCDDENTRNDNSDYPAYSSDREDLENLVHPPRQVNKVDIQYDKVPKQVDVHVLKDVLWSNIQESIQMSDVGIEGHLATFVLHLSLTPGQRAPLEPPQASNTGRTRHSHPLFSNRIEVEVSKSKSWS